MCSVHFYYLFDFVCVCIPAHLYIYQMCLGAHGDQKKHQIPWRYRGCELPGEQWELNLGALQEPRVLLTTEPSLQYQGDILSTEGKTPNCCWVSMSLTAPHRQRRWWGCAKGLVLTSSLLLNTFCVTPATGTFNVCLLLELFSNIWGLLGDEEVLFRGCI